MYIKNGKKRHNEETIKIQSQLKNGGNNPSAKKVICDGKVYDCIKSCAKDYGIKYPTMVAWLDDSRSGKMPKRFVEMGLKYLDYNENENAITNIKENNCKQYLFNSTKVKINTNKDRSISINSEDMAMCMGLYANITKDGKKYISIKWKVINDYLQELNVNRNISKDSYIEESIVYSLAEKVNTDKSVKFASWLKEEVIAHVNEEVEVECNDAKNGDATQNFEEASCEVQNENENISVINDLINDNGKILVSSRAVAERFEKRHNDVVNAIENKIENLTTKKFTVKKLFIQSEFEHKGNLYKEYLLTRDGFAFIVMGFTGLKADMWKLAYIEAFNMMEDKLRQNNIQQQTAQTSIDTLEQIKLLIDQAQQERNDLVKQVEEKQKRLDLHEKAVTDIPIGNISKNFGFSSTHKFNLLLEALGIQYYTGSVWKLCEPYDKKGYASIKNDTYEDENSPKVKPWLYWNEKGKLFLYDTLKEIGINPIVNNEGDKTNEGIASNIISGYNVMKKLKKMK